MDKKTREDILKHTGKGWYGLSGCPDGWLEIIATLHKKIVALYPDYVVYQIKEKFGGLRYYCSVEGIPEVEKLIEETTKACESICQHCGSTDQVAVRGKAWIYCVCNKCEEKILNENNT